MLIEAMTKSKAANGAALQTFNVTDQGSDDGEGQGSDGESSSKEACDVKCKRLRKGGVAARLIA